MLYIYESAAYIKLVDKNGNISAFESPILTGNNENISSCMESSRLLTNRQIILIKGVPVVGLEALNFTQTSLSLPAVFMS